MQTEHEKYIRAWSDQMVKIWSDRIARFRAVDTGRLLASVSADVPTVDGFSAEATFRFLEYGIYVDAGTGNGYRRGNGGNLEFLGKAYRKAHGLTRQRIRRPWFSVSWAVSRRVLADKLTLLMGDAFIAAFDNL